MMHPQPTSVLLLNANYEARIERHAGPGPLLGLLVRLREIRKPTAASVETVADASAALPAGLSVHGGGQSPRVRSGLGGRMEQARRRRGARAERGRGDLHFPGRRADRRGL